MDLLSAIAAQDTNTAMQMLEQSTNLLRGNLGVRGGEGPLVRHPRAAVGARRMGLAGLDDL